MLEVKNLNVAYGDARALWDVALTVDASEIVMIVGPNGAGKTTVVNALAGLIPVHSGQILLNGRDMTRIAKHRFCELGIAIVPEGRRIFTEMSVRHNLDLGAYVPSARQHHAETLEQVYSLFPILKERENQIAGTMSGGQQQMLALGRALMARPRVLLLDEPSLGLAPVIVDQIFDAILEINEQGVSVLIVEQNVVKALQIADRGYVIEEGRIIQSGDAHALLNDSRIKQAYLGLPDTPEVEEAIEEVIEDVSHQLEEHQHQHKSMTDDA